jgi:hypothetical protein
MTDLALLKELLALLDASSATTIEIRRGFTSYRVSRESAPGGAAHMAVPGMAGVVPVGASVYGRRVRSLSYLARHWAGGAATELLPPAWVAALGVNRVTVPGKRGRQETTLPIWWIAARVHMSSPKSLRPMLCD